jgi:hypothetical protein
MMRAAVFPDSEHVATTWLRGRPELAGVTVATNLIGWQAGDRRVVITRIGGVPTLAIRIDAPRLDAEVYAEDKGAAHDLAQLVRVALHDLPNGDHTAYAAVVSNVADETGLQWIPEPDTTAARYIFTVRLAVRPYP